MEVELRLYDKLNIMKNSVYLLLVGTLILESLLMNAQTYYTRFVVPDTSDKIQIETRMDLLAYFTTGKVDTLFSLLGKDTNIVSLDTLEKYSNLRNRSFDYMDVTDDKYSNWVIGDSTFYVERIFSGPGRLIGSEQKSVVEKVLIMHVDLVFVNDRAVITRIIFKITTPDRDIYQNYLIPYSKAAQRNADEDIRNKTNEKYPPPIPPLDRK